MKLFLSLALLCFAPVAAAAPPKAGTWILFAGVDFAGEIEVRSNQISGEIKHPEVAGSISLSPKKIGKVRKVKKRRKANNDDGPSLYEGQFLSGGPTTVRWISTGDDSGVFVGKGLAVRAFRTLPLDPRLAGAWNAYLGRDLARGAQTFRLEFDPARNRMKSNGRPEVVRQLAAGNELLFLEKRGTRTKTSETGALKVTFLRPDVVLLSSPQAPTLFLVRDGKPIPTFLSEGVGERASGDERCSAPRKEAQDRLRRLHQLQRTHHKKTGAYAKAAKELGFDPNDGADFYRFRIYAGDQEQFEAYGVGKRGPVLGDHWVVTQSGELEHKADRCSP